MNARFNVYINGQTTKLTLTPGQRLHHFKSYRTDEGWSSELEVWEHRGTYVYRYSKDDGVDCDGRLSQSCELICPLNDLQSHEYEGIKLPTWQRLKAWQRDYQAESRGY